MPLFEALVDGLRGLHRRPNKLVDLLVDRGSRWVVNGVRPPPVWNQSVQITRTGGAAPRGTS
jgi:hypothetical protein